MTELLLVDLSPSIPTLSLSLSLFEHSLAVLQLGWRLCSSISSMEKEEKRGKWYFVPRHLISDVQEERGNRDLWPNLASIISIPMTFHVFDIIGPEDTEIGASLQPRWRNERFLIFPQALEKSLSDRLKFCTRSPDKSVGKNNSTIVFSLVLLTRFV